MHLRRFPGDSRIKNGHESTTNETKLESAGFYWRKSGCGGVAVGANASTRAIQRRQSRCGAEVVPVRGLVPREERRSSGDARSGTNLGGGPETHRDLRSRFQEDLRP